MTFTPADAPNFPAGMRVSPDRAPRFAVDFGTIFFGPPPDYDASLLVPKKGTPEQAKAARNGGTGR